MLAIATAAAAVDRSRLARLIVLHRSAAARAARFNREVGEPAEQQPQPASRLSAIHRIDDRLCARETEALADVAEHQVANAKELCMKIVYLNEVGAWDFPPVAECIAVDARRLGGEA